MQVADQVTILEPFGPAFPGTFTIAKTDCTTAWLNDSQGQPVESAFDFMYLQKVTG